MHRNRRVFGHCISCLVLLLNVAAACSGGSDTSGPPPTIPVATVSVDPATTTLLLDAERTLAVTMKASDGTVLTGRSVDWSSADGSIATVSQQGVVRGIRAGTVRISATSEGKTGFSDITVQNPLPTIASVSPANAQAGSIAFVLTIDGTGFASNARIRWNGQERATTFVSRSRLTAQIAAGDITTAGNQSVTVVNPSPGGGTSQTLTFVVAPPAVANVTVSPANARLVPGETRQLSAKVVDGAGAELAGRQVGWSSATQSVTTVSNNGLVTAVSPGTALITATSEGKSGTSSITVVPGALIGAAGGQVTAGSVFVDVPAGALSAPVAISVIPEPNPPPHPRLVAGSAHLLGPSGQSFAQPVTVRIAWAAGQEAVGSNPSLFAVHRWNGSAWIPLADRVTDVGARTARGRTTTFSVFALIELTPNPAPVLISINPTAVDAGSGDTDVTLTGTGFVATSVALVDNVAVPTTFVSATQLTAKLSASMLASAGTRVIAVRSPTPGGGESATKTFTVRPPSGTTITVNTTLAQAANPSQCTLRGAVQAANTNLPVDGCAGGSTVNPDVIVVPAGTYMLPSTLSFTDPTGATLRGQSPATTNIDGNFVIQLMTTANGSGVLRVEHLTLRNGSGASGAAIRTATSLIIDDVHFLQNNAANEGGAIDASFQSISLTITNSVFTDNEADEGGAIESQGAVSISRSTFTQNKAREQQGGAIEVGSAPLEIVDSDFINNTSVIQEGGAIFKFGGSMTISGSTFSGNTATQDAGAVGLTNGSMSISSSTFSTNSSAISGGAVYIEAGTLQLTNVTMHANTAQAGAAIRTGTAATTLRHVTITGSTSGGAIHSSQGAAIDISNSILADNGGSSCAGQGVRTSTGGNVQTDGSCGLAQSTDQTVANALLGVLQLNGGRTRTRLPIPGSPAIDAGVTARCLAVDQRGILRPQGNACDAGAVEVTVSASQTRRR